MAELKVQPKKGSSWILWLLLLLGIIAVVYFLTRNNDTDPATNTIGSNADSVAVNPPDNAQAETRDEGWAAIDWNASRLSADEIKTKDVEVRGNEMYGIYSLNETILFEEGKTDIRSSAENNLKEIAASISKRYNGGKVRIYGHTDAQGEEASNRQLSEQRATAVQQWLMNKGNLSGTDISVHARGEDEPVASNDDEKGRKKNRRVEIVAMKQNNQQ
jgi:outer membrane protein OmpA-like peptidoglycan-associated protein